MSPEEYQELDKAYEALGAGNTAKARELLSVVLTKAAARGDADGEMAPAYGEGPNPGPELVGADGAAPAPVQAAARLARMPVSNAIPKLRADGFPEPWIVRYRARVAAEGHKGAEQMIESGRARLAEGRRRDATAAQISKDESAIRSRRLA